MSFSKSKNPHISSPANLSPPQHLNLHQAFSTLQNHCSGLLHHFTISVQNRYPESPFIPNPYSLKTNLESTLSNLGNQAKHAVEAGIRSFETLSRSGSLSISSKTLNWARISEPSFKGFDPLRQRGSSLSTEAMEERLAGVPVYALSNSSEEFVLVSGVKSGKSLGLFCFKKEDADALLEQMKSMDPTMRQGSQVVPVALNKVFQLKVDGVAFRLVPEVAQIKNALREMEKSGLFDQSILGVPVFKSQSLVLRSQKRTYRPVFFRKEDLEDSLLRASHQQGRLNPAFRRGDIQVAVLEKIIEGMKDDTTSDWDDVVFVPPGFDVSTGPFQK